MDVFVTGIGIVSALGIGVARNLNALVSGTSGIKKNTLLDGLTKDTFVGELSISNSDMINIEFMEMTGFPNDIILPRTALLGIQAAKEALGSTLLDHSRTGFINGTTVGGMDLTERYFRDVYLNNEHRYFYYTSAHDLGTMTNIISQGCKIKGYVNTISTACSSSANSIMLGARLIKAGILDRVLVGGTDALSQFTINGFRSLMIYDDQICQPFDNNRRGLNLGEGAGYLLLENEASLKATKNEKLARVTGWHNANDAYHQTGTSPEGDGAMKAMKGALEMAQLAPEDIDYVNAHGTATGNNDQSESSAIERIFGKNGVAFSSTKGYTGHTLGAAGGIEAVLSVLSISGGCIFPNINLKTPMADVLHHPVTEYRSGEKIGHVMSNSFGFGGNSTSLIFSKK